MICCQSLLCAKSIHFLPLTEADEAVIQSESQMIKTILGGGGRSQAPEGWLWRMTERLVLPLKAAQSSTAGVKHSSEQEHHKGRLGSPNMALSALRTAADCVTVFTSPCQDHNAVWNEPEQEEKWKLPVICG